MSQMVLVGRNPAPAGVGWIFSGHDCDTHCETLGMKQHSIEETAALFEIRLIAKGSSRLQSTECIPLGVISRSVRKSRISCPLDGSRTSIDIPQIDSDSPGGVGVGRHLKARLSAALKARSAVSTLCKVAKVRITLDNETSP